jgi:hypothetical protein
MRAILRSADFQSGVMFLALAALGLWLSSGLRLGTAMRMGPGYLPTLISSILLFLGLGTIAVALARPGSATERWYLRPLVGILASLLVFAFGIERLGLFVTTMLVLVVASLATRESRWIEVLLVAVGLAAFSTSLFIWTLGLPIPAWPQGLAP